jgi:dTDP-4-dehydrorhamnose 3,5-epimerase
MPDTLQLAVEPTPLAGVWLLKPRVYPDARGHFLESWHRPRLAAAGLQAEFVQDNVVTSRHRVLRGLHYQQPCAQVKLVTVLHGEVFDVVVDIRHGSPTFGRWFGLRLDGTAHWQLWIEPGFAHGYQVLSESAVINYKCSHIYEPSADRTISYADPAIGIQWPLGDPIVSGKDAAARPLADMARNEIFTHPVSLL